VEPLTAKKAVVLVVEDEPLLRLAAAEFIEDEAFSRQRSNAGRTGISCSRESRPPNDRLHGRTW
jgi:DNA-binding response OmpR family regulator